MDIIALHHFYTAKTAIGLLEIFLEKLYIIQYEYAMFYCKCCDGASPDSADKIKHAEDCAYVQATNLVKTFKQMENNDGATTDAEFTKISSS